MSNRRVAVVGAGISGLVAAFELVKAGVEVTVFDGADVAGGKIRTSSLAGHALDEGPDAFLARVPFGTDLCHELGLGDELVAPSTGTAYLWSEGRLRPFPSGLMLGVPTDLESLEASGIVSADGLAALRADAGRTAALDAEPTGDETIGAMVRRRLGAEVLDKLIDPLMSGIFAGNSERLSLRTAAPQLAAAAAHGPSLVAGARAQLAAATHGHPSGHPVKPVFLTLRGGLQVLVDALVDAIGGPTVLRLNQVVRSVDARDNAMTLAVSSNGRDQAFDGVILALPGPASAELLAALSPGASAPLASLAYASVAMVSFAFRADDVGRPLDGSGFLVPRSAGLLMTACSWSSAKFAHLGEDGLVRLRVSAGRVDDTRIDLLSDAELVAAIEADLRTTMGIEQGALETRISRWPQSLPQYEPGHLDRVAEVERQLTADCPQVTLAGAALHGVGLPACINSGRQAANRLVSQLEIERRNS